MNEHPQADGPDADRSASGGPSSGAEGTGSGEERPAAARASRRTDSSGASRRTEPSGASRRTEPSGASRRTESSGATRRNEAARAEEHEWIRRAQAGDEDAFGQLVGRYQARALRAARNMVPHEEDARDLVQEAFLRVFRNLERFNFKNEFGTWLYRIVTNLAIDHLRKRRPSMSTSTSVDEEETDFDLADPRDERPSDAMEALETAAEVNDCLSSLAPHFQSVLKLRELEGMACNDIAEIVGATHVTVRWRLHRGRKLFQDEWERRKRVAEAQAETLDGPLDGRQLGERLETDSN